MARFERSFALVLILFSLNRAEFVEGAVEASRAPKIVDTVERINHPEETNATFSCTIGSGDLAGLKFEWLKNDKRIVGSDRHRITVAQENYNSVLRVIDLRADDSGVYSCVARNAFGHDQISIKLFVKVTLKWLDEPRSEIESSVGKQLHVPCTASGQPTPKIEWTRLDGDESSMRQSFGSELRFGALSQQDSGLYECRASNGMDKDLVARSKLTVLGGKASLSFRMRRMVQFAVLGLALISFVGFGFVSCAIEASKVPKIVDQVERINHPEETNATFSCTIGSGELNGLKFEWFKDEKRIAAGSNRYRISVAPENYNSVLRVIDLKSEDTGSYSCVAKNAFGQDKISIKLLVKVELKWIVAPEAEIETSIGKELHIPCSAAGQPAPKIEWTRLDGSGHRQSLGSELRLSAASQQDSGLYECRASNGLEKDLVARTQVNVMATTYYNILPILGSIKRLPGYDDKNFLLTDSSENKTYVLKIVNRVESVRELTDIIDEILDNAYEYSTAKKALSPDHFSVPKLIRTTGAKLSTRTTVKHCRLSEGEGGGDQEQFEDVKCNIKLSQFFDGMTIYDYVNGCANRTVKQQERLYRKLGRVCNQLFVFLRTQQHLYSDLDRVRTQIAGPWHLQASEKHINQNLDKLFPGAEHAERRLVLQVLEEFRTLVKPKLSQLPNFILHSDLSTKNMLASTTNSAKVPEESLDLCLIDFQDLQTGPRVVDLANLMLYSIIEQEAMPFERALAMLPRWIFAGYQTASSWPLNADELELVPSLMKLRLCRSLLNGLVAFEQAPENSYVLQTNQRGWSLLGLMSDSSSLFGKPDQLATLWSEKVSE